MYDQCRWSNLQQNQTDFKKDSNSQFLKLLLAIVVTIACDFDLWLQFFYWNFDPVTSLIRLWYWSSLILMAKNPNPKGQLNDALDSRRLRTWETIRSKTEAGQEIQFIPRNIRYAANKEHGSRHGKVPSPAAQSTSASSNAPMPMPIDPTSHVDTLTENDDESGNEKVVDASKERAFPGLHREHPSSSKTPNPNPVVNPNLNGADVSSDASTRNVSGTETPIPGYRQPMDLEIRPPTPTFPVKQSQRNFGIGAKKNYYSAYVTKQLSSKTVKQHLPSPASKTLSSRLNNYTRPRPPEKEKEKNPFHSNIKRVNHLLTKAIHQDQNQDQRQQGQDKEPSVEPSTTAAAKHRNTTSILKFSNSRQFISKSKPPPKSFRNRDRDRDQDRNQLLKNNPADNSTTLTGRGRTNDDSRPPLDPFIKRIQDYHLPIVWIIGEPTTHVKQIVHRYCEQLADSLDFKYINLDEKIGELYEREVLSVPTKFWQKLNVNVREKKGGAAGNPTSKRDKNSNNNNGPQDQSPITDKDKESSSQPRLTIAPPKRGCQIRAKVKLTESLTHQSILYDKKLKQFLRQGGVPIIPKFENSQLLNNLRKLNEIFIDTKEPLKREKIMEIFKYSMVESLQSTMATRGFIIDGSFTDRHDFVKFKQMFYLPTVGLYFTESPINNEMAKYRATLSSLSDQANVLKATMDDTERLIRSKVTVVKPRHFRRIKQYSFIDADYLCDEFKDKVVRVVNAEHLNWSTVKYINSLVRSHLKHDNDASDGDSSKDLQDRHREHEILQRRSRLRNKQSSTSLHGGKFQNKSKTVVLNSPGDGTGKLRLMEYLQKSSTHQTAENLFAPTHSTVTVADGKDQNSVATANNKLDRKMYSSTVTGASNKVYSSSQLNSHSVPQVLLIKNDDLKSIQEAEQKIDMEFDKFRYRNLPIIWIYGYKQAAVASQRQNCCIFLAKYFNFAFLQMDEQIVKWYRYSLKNYWQQQKQEDRGRESSKIFKNNADVHELIFHRAKHIIKKVIPGGTKSILKNAVTADHSESRSSQFLTQTECITLIKYAMIHSMPTNGFIIDNFPLNSSEATEFEKFIYPVALGLYFSSGNSTATAATASGSGSGHGSGSGSGSSHRSHHNKKRIEKPKYFIRGTPYSEQLIDTLCSDFAKKSIRILNVEDLQPKGMEEICGLVEQHLKVFKKGPNSGGGGSPSSLNSAQNFKSQKINSKAKTQLQLQLREGNNNSENVHHQKKHLKTRTSSGKTPILKTRTSSHIKSPKKLKDSWTQHEIVILKHTSVPENLTVHKHTTLQNAHNVARPKRQQEHFNSGKRADSSGRPPRRSGSRSPSPKYSVKGQNSPTPTPTPESVVVDPKQQYTVDADNRKRKKHNNNGNTNVSSKVKIAQNHNVKSVVKLWEGKHIKSVSDINLMMEFGLSPDPDPGPDGTENDSQDGENRNQRNDDLTVLMAKKRVSEPGHSDSPASSKKEDIIVFGRSVKSFNHVSKWSHSGAGTGTGAGAVGDLQGLVEAQNYIGNVTIPQYYDQQLAPAILKGDTAAAVAGHQGVGNNAVLPQISDPSTMYETANSSEDDFDEDDEDSEMTLTRTSTIQGLIFGADGRKSKNGLITPNSQLMAITISHKNSEIPLAQIIEESEYNTATAGVKEELENLGQLDPSRDRNKHKQHHRARPSPSRKSNGTISDIDKNRSKFGKFISGFFGVFRRTRGST